MMGNRKYKLTEESQIIDGRVEVFRIEAVNSFGDVRVGDLGGFIGSEDDLTNDLGDDSWVYDESIAYGFDYHDKNIYQAQGVSDGAKVMNGSVVKNSIIGEGAVIDGSRLEDSIVKDSNVKDSQILNDSGILGSKSVRDATLDRTSFIDMMHVSGGSFLHSSAQFSEARDTVMEGSTMRHSKSDGSILVDSDIYKTIVSSGSEIHFSKNIRDADITSSSLNHMVEVDHAVFRNTHAQESSVKDSYADHSKLKHANIYDNAKISRSDISLSNVSGGSRVTDSILRSFEDPNYRSVGVKRTDIRKGSDVRESKVYGSVLSGASCHRSYLEGTSKMGVHVEDFDSTKGLELSDIDLNDLEDNGMRL